MSIGRAVWYNKSDIIFHKKRIIGKNTFVSFGEIMLRLKSPPGYDRLFQSPTLEATFGGGEANVAVSLANYGLDANS